MLVLIDLNVTINENIILQIVTSIVNIFNKLKVRLFNSKKENGLIFM